MWNESIIVAAISGAFALAGGFLGAFFTRRSEHEKWLRRERSAAFAEFLRQLHAVLEKVIPVVCGSESTGKKEMKVTELFLGLNAQENIVRLYLKPEDRDNFSQLVKDLWILSGPSTEVGRRIKEGKERLLKIQSMFETTIDT